MEGVVLVVLGITGIWDLKQKEIPLKLVIIMTLIGVGIHSLIGGVGRFYYLSCLIPASIFFIFSVLSKQSVGFGDGFILLFLGVYAGLFVTVEVLLIGLFINFLISLLLLLGKGVKLSYEIPFVPILFFAYLLRCIWK